MDRPANRRDPGHRGGRRFWGGGRRADRRPGLRGRGAPAQRADAGRLGAARQRGRRLGDRGRHLVVHRGDPRTAGPVSLARRCRLPRGSAPRGRRNRRVPGTPSDSAFAYLTTAQSYGPAQLIDTGWIAGYLLIGLGAFFATLAPKSSLKADDEPPGRWSLALPYVPVAIAATVTVVWNVSGSPDLFLFWGMMGVAGLVLLRQFIVLWDNLALNQKLEAQAAALRDTETNFRSLVQNSGDVVVLADAAGTRRFLSTSIDRFFAYSPTELVGQPFAELLHPTDKSIFDGGVQKALTASAHPISVSCRVRH